MLLCLGFEAELFAIVRYLTVRFFYQQSGLTVRVIELATIRGLTVEGLKFRVTLRMSWFKGRLDIPCNFE